MEDEYRCPYIQVLPDQRWYCPYKATAEKIQREMEIFGRTMLTNVEPNCPSNVKRDKQGFKICYIIRRS